MSRIINLRGTSGAGKSHIVRHIMSLYPERESIFTPGRKQPLGYICRREGHPELFVVGHYEIACGGADTLSKEMTYCGQTYDGIDLIYFIINRQAEMGHDVIFEGLMVSSDWRRCAELRHKYQLLVVGLDTPLAECNAAVEDRRQAKIDKTGRIPAPLKLGKDGTPKNSQAKYKALLTQRSHFRNAGVDLRILNRKDAMDACLAFFGLDGLRIAQAESVATG